MMIAHFFFLFFFFFVSHFNVFSSPRLSGEGQNERTAVRIEVLLAFEAVLSQSDDDDDVDDVSVRAHMGVCVVGAADLLVAVFEGEREREREREKEKEGGFLLHAKSCCATHRKRERER